ncbi:MAG: sugar phosphate isomerase/epimerase, partial [Bacteroidaceae bacterium]|nr:sugar phosphate isomerase/epimerase [Bacteroidaceae bacterium]
MKRRDFLRTGVAASAALALPQNLVAAAPGDIPASKNSTYERRQRQEPFHLGMAGYTFRHFDIDQALAFMKRLDVHYLCIKDFHLPLDASAEQIAAFKQKLAEAGVVGYGVGPIYMRSEAEVDRAFAYAKRVGVSLLVGVPNYELLDYAEKAVKQY